jgi:hypothetical protein
VGEVTLWRVSNHTKPHKHTNTENTSTTKQSKNNDNSCANKQTDNGKENKTEGNKKQKEKQKTRSEIAKRKKSPQNAKEKSPGESNAGVRRVKPTSLPDASKWSAIPASPRKLVHILLVASFVSGWCLYRPVCKTAANFSS